MTYLLLNIYVYFSVEGLLDLIGLGDIDWDEVDWDNIEDSLEEDATAGAERDDNDDDIGKCDDSEKGK